MPDLQDALAPLGRMGMLSMSRCCLRGVPPAVVHMTSLLVSVAWIAPLLHSTSSLLLHPACFHFCGVSILLCVSSHCLLSPPSRPSTSRPPPLPSPGLAHLQGLHLEGNPGLQLPPGPYLARLQELTIQVRWLFTSVHSCGKWGPGGAVLL